MFVRRKYYALFFLVINTAEPLDSMCRRSPVPPLQLFRAKTINIDQAHQVVDVGFYFGIEGFANQIKIARHSRLFAYSNGNPGVAMNAWLTGIQDYADKMITWKKPVVQDLSVLRDMPEVWGHLCFQLLIHNRMSIDKMERCLQIDREQIVEITRTMERLYLITQYTPSIYSLNSNMELLLVAYCKEKEWL